MPTKKKSATNDRRPVGRPLTARGGVRKLKHAERRVWETSFHSQEIDVVGLTLRDLRIARSRVQAECEGKPWAC